MADRLHRPAVEADFQGGTLTSDGGLLLLREVDRRLDLIRRIDQVIPDPRDPIYTAHPQAEILTSRIFGIAASLCFERGAIMSPSLINAHGSNSLGPIFVKTRSAGSKPKTRNSRRSKTNLATGLNTTGSVTGTYSITCPAWAAAGEEGR